jgi:hypothetical protein
MGMLEPREWQAEVVEPVAERLARDGDAELTHIGKVRQAHPARRVLLAEDHIPAGVVERPPFVDATLDEQERRFTARIKRAICRLTRSRLFAFVAFQPTLKARQKPLPFFA